MLSLPRNDAEDDSMYSEEEDETDSKSTSLEAAAIVYAYSLRHKVSKASMSDLLTMVNMLNPEGGRVPGSKYLLEKQLEPDFSQVFKSLYCKNCEAHVKTTDNICLNCQTVLNEDELLKSGKFYLQFDICHVLRNLLEIPQVGKNLLKNCRNRKANRKIRKHLTDIVDGEWYKKLKLKGNDFSCTMNTDGVSVFSSSKLNIWPIFLCINELDYKLRRKHTKLVGLWIGKTKPNFDTFLTPFVDQCNALFDDGMTWCNNGAEITSKVRVIMVAADSVARCMIQGLKQFNGYYSCPWCYIKGEKCDMESGGHKMIFPPSNNRKRTDASFLKDLKKLGKIKRSKKVKSNKKPKHVNGVQSASPLVGLTNFNMVKGFTLDYMHTAILGVLRTLELLIQQKNQSDFVM
jgi:hypothetical protein